MKPIPRLALMLVVFPTLIALACESTVPVQEQRIVPIKETQLVDATHSLCQTGTIKQRYIDGPHERFSSTSRLSMQTFLAENPYVLVLSTIKIGGRDHWPELVVTYCVPK